MQSMETNARRQAYGLSKVAALVLGMGGLSGKSGEAELGDVAALLRDRPSLILRRLGRLGAQPVLAERQRVQYDDGALDALVLDEPSQLRAKGHGLAGCRVILELEPRTGGGIQGSHVMVGLGPASSRGPQVRLACGRR
jgi:hypothetical protein